MAQMTPRERVETALRHEEPDRVPLDIGGSNSTSLSIEAYENMKVYLGIEAPTRVISKVFRTAFMDEKTMDVLGGDVRPLLVGPPNNWSPSPSEPGTFISEYGIKYRLVEYERGHYYCEAVTCPLADMTLNDVDSINLPDPYDPGRFEGLAERVHHLYNETSYAIAGDCVIKGFWEPYLMMRGMTQAFVDLLINKDFFFAVMDRLWEINTEVAKRFLEITGSYLTVFRYADDIATQAGLMMSPETYREMIQPYHKRFNAFVREYTDAKIFYHSCGNVVGMLDDLVDAGIDIINPVQVSATGDPSPLKAKYGDKLSFWGAIDTQHVLPHGTPEDVREEVKLRIRQLGAGGGYVANPVHTVQPDVSPQNILAVRDAVMEFGHYPINLE